MKEVLNRVRTDLRRGRAQAARRRVAVDRLRDLDGQIQLMRGDVTRCARNLSKRNKRRDFGGAIAVEAELVLLNHRVSEVEHWRKRAGDPHFLRAFVNGGLGEDFDHALEEWMLRAQE